MSLTITIPGSLPKPETTPAAAISTVVTLEESSSTETPPPPPYTRKLAWPNIIKLALLHVAFLVSLVLAPFAQNATLLFSLFLLLSISLVGVQLGTHRLWAHRTFKANTALRVIAAFFQTAALQKDIYDWCRDHRAHHKWSDTDADPHNAGRGFFFSHIGWLMVKKHPELLRKGATLDLSDLEADPIVMFQRKYYHFLWPIAWGVIPTFIPVLLWDEYVVLSFFLCVIYRYLLSVQVSGLVNSWAHAYGMRPYNKDLLPTEANCRHALLGEGFHNYHHAFPADYSASEFGPADVFNPATAIINGFAAIGWATDLKRAQAQVVERTIEKKGEPDVARYSNANVLYEWLSGLAVITAPFWGILLWKYLALYIYFLYFPMLPSFDLVTLFDIGRFVFNEAAGWVGVAVRI